MLEFFRKLAAYFGAKGNYEFDKRADPRIQIEQVIDEAKRRHESLTQQAATVIGNEHHLKAKFARQEGDVEKLEASARQAILMAQQALDAGDAKRAQEMENTATAFATQLTAAETALEDLRSLLEDAKVASQQAKDAVANNTLALQEKLAERTRLLSQLEAAKMQEKINEATKAMGDLAVPGKTPTFDGVRDKVEARAAAAKGASDLNRESVGGQMMEVQRAALNAGAQTRLDQLRTSMGINKAAPASAEETPTLASPTATAPAAEKSSN